jgi:YgiT-type zinc finger domain-containing protein
MNCFLCKGHLNDQTSAFMVELEHAIVVVKQVPSQVCGQCGEISYSNRVAKRLEQIVQTLSAQSEPLTDIAVMDYQRLAA